MKASFWSDLLFAFRTLRRAPLFAAVAITSLALGLGANTAIFSILDRLLLRPLPIAEPERLVLLETNGPNMGMFFCGETCFSYPMYRDIRDRNQVFTGLAGRFPVSVNLQTSGQADSVRGEIVSGNYFQVLGVGAALGRTLLPEDDLRKGEHPVAVLSYDSWMRRFGGDPALLGKDIRLNGRAFTVVGIARPGFFGAEVGRRSELFVPMMMKAAITPTWDEMENSRTFWVNMFGRLKPGVTLQQAEASLKPVLRPILEQEVAQMGGGVPKRFAERYVQKPLLVKPGGKGVENVREFAGKPLVMLMAMVGLVLLIACANVANLLMARAASRQKEIAIRLALGAGRWRIVRQLLVESALLSVLGGAMGLLVASWTVEGIVSFLPEELAQSNLVTGLDLRVLGFSMLLAIATGLLFGLVPALQATRPDVAPTLKDQAGSVIGGWRGLKSRKALVVAQVALSLLLLVGSGLFVRSLQNLRSLDPGFSTANLIAFDVDASLAAYPPERVQQVYSTLEQRLATLPGVTGATIAETALIAGQENFSTVRVQGYEHKPGEDMNPQTNSVGRGFFRAMGIPLLYGREFTDADIQGSPKVAIVNESFARYFFKGGSPLGRRFGRGGSNNDFEIVGVVKDGKYNSMRDKPTRMFYLPWRQTERLGQVTIYVRTGFDPAQAFSMLRREVASAAPGMAMFNNKTVERQVDESLMIDRLIATLCTMFGALATLLAAIGLYGVMAYSVARRTREIGIRVALGAERGQVLRMIMREVGWMALFGVGIGLPLSLWLSRLLESQLYGLSPNDPLTVAGATLLIVIVALISGALPARRAARVDPLSALRYE